MRQKRDLVLLFVTGRKVICRYYRLLYYLADWRQYKRLIPNSDAHKHTYDQEIPSQCDYTRYVCTMYVRTMRKKKQ